MHRCEWQSSLAMSSSPLMALKWTLVMSCGDTLFLFHIDLSSLFVFLLFASNFISKVL